MSESKSTSSGGIGLFGAIFIVFLVLKLVAVEPVASWSWWWVTAPLWGGAALVLGIGGVVIAIGVLASMVSAIGDGIRSRRRVRRMIDE